jgi:hypothetical protein
VSESCAQAHDRTSIVWSFAEQGTFRCRVGEGKLVWVEAVEVDACGLYDRVRVRPGRDG